MKNNNEIRLIYRSSNLLRTSLSSPLSGESSDEDIHCEKVDPRPKDSRMESMYWHSGSSKLRIHIGKRIHVRILFMRREEVRG